MNIDNYLEDSCCEELQRSWVVAKKDIGSRQDFVSVLRCIILRHICMPIRISQFIRRH